MNAPFIVAQANTAGTNAASPQRVIRVVKPQDSQAVTVRLDGDARLDLSEIGNEKVTFVRVGDRLVIVFDNQSAIGVEGAFDQNGQPNPNLSFLVDGNRSVSGADFASLFPITTDQSILPAAGNAASAPASAANFQDAAVDGFGARNALDLLAGEGGAGALGNADDAGANDIPTIGSILVGNADDEGLSEGNIDGPGDEPGNATSITNSLSINFGQDFGNAFLNFGDENGGGATNGTFTNLTSGGSVVNVIVTTLGGLPAIVGYIGNDPTQNLVFTVTLNVDANAGTANQGEYTFTLLQPLDHPEAGTEDTFVLQFDFTAHDGNGDFASASFLVRVNDDSPELRQNEEPNNENSEQQAVDYRAATVDDEGLDGGNEGDSYPGGTDAATSDRTATGSLGISWGADRDNDLGNVGFSGSQVNGDRSVVFAQGEGINQAPEDLTSAGETVHYLVLNNGTVLVAYTGTYGSESESELSFNPENPGENVVFYVTLDDSTAQGSFEFHLLRPLDHGQVNAEDDINLNFDFVARDADGDPIDGSLAIVVNDDGPVLLMQNEGPVSSLLANPIEYRVATVDDEGLNGGNPDGSLSDDPDAATADASMSASLGISWGADNGNKADLVGFNGTQVLGDRSVVFAAGEGVNAAPEGLTSAGQSVRYELLNNGTLLVAHTGDAWAEGATFDPNAIGQDVVFYVTLSDLDNGSFDFHLVRPLDHGTVATEDDITLNFDFVARDADGDAIDGSFAVTVNDDGPVLLDNESEGPSAETPYRAATVDDEGLTGGNLDGSSTDNPDAATSSPNMSASLGISWGADNGNDTSLVGFNGTQVLGDRSVVFADGEGVNVAPANLTSGGEPVQYVVLNNGTLLVAYTGDEAPESFDPAAPGASTVFYVTLSDLDNGSFDFHLVRPLDHDPEVGGATEDDIDLNFDFVARDADGDTVDGSFTVTVNDDGPTLSNVYSGPNLIANGNFMAGDWPGSATWGNYDDTVEGWTLTGPQLERVHSGYLGAVSPTGSDMVDLDASPGNVSLSQTIDGMTDGKSYELSFEIGRADGAYDAKLEVYWNGVLIDTYTPNTGTLQVIKVPVTADGTSNTLEFREVGTADNSGTFLANVSLRGVNGVVDDESINGNVGDSYEVGDAPGAAAMTEGSLGISWGADRDNDSGNVGFNGTQVLGDRSVVFTTDQDGQYAAPEGLTAHGEAVHYVVLNFGTLLVAYTGDTEPTSFDPNEPGTAVFYVTLSDTTDSGSFEFHLVRPLDHEVANVEDDIDLNFDFTARDADGDAVEGSFKVTVNDDGPVQNSNTTVDRVYENDLNNYAPIAHFLGWPIEGSTGTSPDSDTAWHGGVATEGSVASLVTFGADGAAAGGGFDFSFANDTDATSAVTGLGLSSKGEAIDSARVFGDWLVAGTDDRVVFALKLNDDGTYRFVLFDQLDHAPGDASPDALDAVKDWLDIDFSSFITATDFDGDSITLDSESFVIRVRDDIPEVVGAETGNANENDLANFNPLFPLVLDFWQGSLGTSPYDGGTDNSITGLLGTVPVWGTLADNIKGGADETGKFHLVSEERAEELLATLGPGANEDGAPISSHGHAVNDARLITLDGIGEVMGFFADDGRLVFALYLADNGIYNFRLFDQIDHPQGDDLSTNTPEAIADYLDIDFSHFVTFTDRDGDTIDLGNGTFVMTVTDDIPVVIGSIAITLDEDDLASFNPLWIDNLFELIPWQGSTGTSPDGDTDLLIGTTSQQGFLNTIIGNNTVHGGADEFGHFGLVVESRAETVLGGMNLTSKGSAINDVRVLDLGDLGEVMGFFAADGRLVFSLSVNDLGLYDVRLFDQLDHTYGDNQQGTLSIDLSKFITYTDFDGDSIDLSGVNGGNFVLNIIDDVPEASGTKLSFTVEEEQASVPVLTDLVHGNEDSDGEGDNDTAGNNAVTGNSTLGSLSSLIKGGADDNGAFSFNTAVAGQPVTNAAGEALSSRGVPLYYSLQNILGVPTLVGFADTNGDHQISLGERWVFTLTLADLNPLDTANNAEFVFTLLDAIDHPDANGGSAEDIESIDLSGTIKYTDRDGDSTGFEAGTLKIDVIDDVPVQVAGKKVTGTVEEEQLPGGNDDYTSAAPDIDADADIVIIPNILVLPNYNATTETATGNLRSLVSVGADESSAALVGLTLEYRGKFALSADTSGLPSVTVKNAPVAYAVTDGANSDTLTGYIDVDGSGTFNAGDTKVFTLEVDSVGGYTFKLFSQIDHSSTPGQSIENVSELDFSSIIRFSDNDGDTIGLTSNSFTINVIDDKPEATTVTVNNVDTNDASGSSNNEQTTLMIDETTGVQTSTSPGNDPDASGDRTLEHDVASLPAVFNSVAALASAGSGIAFASRANALTITPDYGADGGSTTVRLTNSTKADFNGTLTSLKDAQTDKFIYLFTDPVTGIVIGRAGDDAASAASGPIVFAVGISYNESAGNGVTLSLVEYRGIEHTNTSSNDETTSLTNLLYVTSTSTDGDGDVITNLSDKALTIRFDDDGPTAGNNLSGTASDATLVGPNNKYDIAGDDVRPFTVTIAASGVPQAGADGWHGGSFGTAVTFTTPTMSVIDPTTGTTYAVTFDQAGMVRSATSATIYGYIDTNGAAPGGQIAVVAFTLNADGTASYIQGLPLAHAASGGNDDSLALNFTYSLKDGDGDSTPAKTVTVTVADTDPTAAASATLSGSESVIVGADGNFGGGNDVLLDISTSVAAPTSGADGWRGGSFGTAIDFTSIPSSISMIDPNTGTTYAVTFVQTGSVLTGYVTVSSIQIPVAQLVIGEDGTVTYKQVYGLDHGAAANTSMSLTFTYTLTDGDGDTTSTKTVTVNVGDSTPTAQDDTARTLTEDGAAITGNVLTNDAKGTDGAWLREVSFDGGNTWSTVAATGVTSVTNEHGTYLFAADGGWAFYPALNQNNVNNAGVDASFTYKIKDGDNDPSTAVQPVTINDGTNPSVSAPISITVKEAALDLVQDTADLAAGNVNGTNPSSGDETSASTSLVFTAHSDNIVGIAFGDLADIAVTGIKAGTAVFWSLNGTNLEGHIGSPTGPVGIILSISGDVTATAGGDTAAPTITATLTSNFPHADNSDEITVTGIKVVATDTDNDQAVGEVSLTIVDDVPSIVVAPSANLVVNGDFTQGDWPNTESWGKWDATVDGWDLSGTTPGQTGVRLEMIESGYGGATTSNGAPMVDLEATPGNITLSQSFNALTEGQVYVLSFEMGEAAGRDGQFDLFWNGQLVQSYNPTSGAMQIVTVSLVAGSGTNTLSFKETAPAGDNSGTFLANVSLTGAGFGAVDEDGLYHGNAGGAGDLAGAGTVATGSLGIVWGADQADTADAGGVQDGTTANAMSDDTSALTGRAVFFTDANTADADLDLSVTATIGANTVALKSGGADVLFQVLENGTKLVAYTGVFNPNYDGNWVFTLSLSDEDQGGYKFTLLKALDHNVAGTEDDMVLSFGYTARDTDGDTAGGTLKITVDDDTPVLTGTPPVGNVSEANVDGGSNNGFLTQAVGSLKVSGGADKVGVTYTLAADSNGNPLHPANLTSDDVPLLYKFAAYPNENQLIAYKATESELNPVFTITVDGGSYVFTLWQNIDHYSAGNDTLPLSFDVIAKDGDGDTVQQSFTVNVVDDVPTAVKDDAVSFDEDTGMHSGNVMTNDIQGADGATLTKVSFDDGAHWTTIVSGQDIVLSGVGTYTFFANGEWQFTAEQNFNGSTHFAYIITDGDGDESDPAVTIENPQVIVINAVNDAPVAVDDTFSLVPAGWSNPGDNGHIYRFVPTDNSVEWDEARQAASQLLADSKSYLATITSSAEQNFLLMVVTAQSGAQNLIAYLGGQEGATEGEWRWATGPEAGQLFDYTHWYQGGGNDNEPNNNGGNENILWLYGNFRDGGWNDAPSEGGLPFSGYPFGYIAEAGEPGSAYAPIDEDHSYTFNAGILLANDTDVEGDALTVVSVGDHSAKGAVVTLVNGNVTYDPSGVADLQALAAGETTTDTFTYTITDGDKFATATVTVTILGTNDAPVIGLTEQPVTLLNAGFEADTSYDQSGAEGRWHGGSPTGWSVSGPSFGGWFDPEPAALPMEADNGTNVLWLNDGQTASQTLTATAAAGVYDLSVEVGDRRDSTLNGLPQFAIRIYAGNDLVAEKIVAAQLNDGDAWTTVHLEGVIPTGASYIGQPLRIEFANLEADGLGGDFQTTTQVNFDNVSLTFAAAIPPMNTIDEDAVNNQGQTVASILGSTVSDVDHGAVEGIAIIGANDGNGTWQYKNANGEWTDFGTYSVAGALLLRDTDVVRFVPNGLNGTTATFQYVAWDQTSGDEFQTVDVSVRGGTTAFSNETAQATISVTDVNDAPVIGFDISTVTTAEDTPVTLTQAQFQQLMASFVSDSETSDTALTYTFKVDGAVVWTGLGSDFPPAGVTYTPPLNFNGTLPASMTVTDPEGLTATETFSVNVTPVNDAPVVTGENVSLNDTSAQEAGTPISTGNVIANDTDIDSTTLSIVTIRPMTDPNVPVSFVTTAAVVAHGTYGDLTIWPNGDYSYTPNAAFDALKTGGPVTDVFKYGVSDGDIGVPGYLTFTITPSNDIPTLAANAGPSFVDTANDDTFGIVTGTLPGNDRDGDALTYGITSGLNGSFTVPTVSGTFDVRKTGLLGTLFINSATGAYAYVPKDETFEGQGASAFASETLTITVTDTSNVTVSQNFVVSVTGANDTPVLSVTLAGTTYNDTTGDDTFGFVTGSMSSVDRDFDFTATYGVAGGTPSNAEAGYQVAKAGAYGTLYVNTSTGAYKYVPNDAAIEAASTTQQDSFTLTVTDDGNATDGESFTVTINGVNDAPVITPVTVAGTVTEDVNVVSNALHANGSVNFTDVDSSSFIATVGAPTIQTVGGATVSSALSAALTANVGILALSASNTGGTGSVNWTFAIDNDLVQYLGAGESLKLTYQVQVSDGSLSDSESVTVTIIGANDGPVAVADAFTITEDDVDNAVVGNKLTVGNLLTQGTDDSDVDGDTLSVTGISNVQITSNDASLTLNLVAETGGYKITSSYGDAHLSVDSAGNVKIWSDDGDDPFKVLGVSESATLTFTYSISDGNTGTASASATITINGSNDNPVAVNDSLLSGSTSTFTDTFAGGSIAGWTAVSLGGPNMNWHGVGGSWNDAVEYSDHGHGYLKAPASAVPDSASSSTQYTIEVDGDPNTEGGFFGAGDSATNEALGLVFGVADDGSYYRAYWSTFGWVYGLANDSDYRDLVLERVSSNGTVTVLDRVNNVDLGSGWIHFKVEVDSNGIEVTVTGDNETKTLDSTDTPALGGYGLYTRDNDEGVAYDNFKVSVGGSGITTAEDQQLVITAASLLANDTDVDGDTLSIQSVSATSAHGGTVTFANGNVTYTPAANYNGPDSFTYTVTDDHGGTSTATVTLNVTPVADAPTLAAVTGPTYIDTAADDTFPAVTGTLSGQDADGDTLTYGISGGSAVNVTVSGVQYNVSKTSTYGTLYVNSQNGKYTFVPNDGAIENRKTDTSVDFTVTVSDGSSTANQTFTVSIDASNDTPSLSAVTGPTYTDTSSNNTFNSVTGTLSGSDRESDSLTYGISGGTSGNVTVGGVSYNVTKTSAYGTLYVNSSNGKYTFVPNDNAIEGLKTDTTVDFTLTVSDGSTSSNQTFTVTIDGSNDTPTLSVGTGPTFNDTASDNTFNNVTGTFTASDRDSGETFTFGISGGAASNAQSGYDYAKAGTYGILYLNTSTGAYLFIPNDAAIEGRKTDNTEGFTITLVDGSGASASNQIFTVTIDASNDTPTLSAVTGPTYTDTAANDTFNNVSGTFTASDRDNGETFTFGITGGGASNAQSGYNYAKTGTYGTLYVNTSTGAYLFIPNDSAIEGRKTDATENYTITLVDASGASASSQTFTVSIDASNDTPTLTGVAGPTITDTAVDNTFSNVSGTFTANDRDNGETFTFGITGGAASNAQSGYNYAKAGTYGTLFINTSTGAYLFIPNDTAIEARKTDVAENFTITLVDGSSGSATSQTFTVSITGANDTPVLTGVSGASYTDTAIDNSFGNVSGTFSASDRDAGETFTFGITGGAASAAQSGYNYAKLGTYGTLYVNTSTGAYLFIPNDTAIEARKTDTTEGFTVTLTDASGGSTSQTFTVSITGANDTPVLTGVSGAAYTDTAADNSFGNVSGTFTASDRDAGETFNFGITGGAASNAQSGYNYAKAGTYGTLYVNTSTGAYLFIPNDTAIEGRKTDTTEGFTVTLTDASGGSTSQTFTVSITGANDTPTLTGVSGPSYTDTAADNTFNNVSGTFTANDRDAGETFTFGITGGAASNAQSGYNYAKTGTYGTLFINTSTGAYLFIPNDTAIESRKTDTSENFTITLVDGSNASATSQTFTVSITGANDTPTLTAVTGPTYTDTAANDTFNAVTGTLAGADRDGDTLTYGISTGTAGNVTVGGVQYNVTKVGTYGTLYVNSSDGKYTFVPNDTTIEALNAATTESFTLTVSDGSLSSNQTFTVTLNGMPESAVTISETTSAAGRYAFTDNSDEPDSVSFALSSLFSNTTGSVTYSVSNVYATDPTGWLNFTAAGSVSGNPVSEDGHWVIFPFWWSTDDADGDAGLYTYRVTATDSTGATQSTYVAFSAIADGGISFNVSNNGSSSNSNSLAYANANNGDGDLITITNTSVTGQLNAGAGHDVVIGHDAVNLIDGGAGDDAIYGMGGADTLSGASGNDFVDGGDGNDTIYGDDAVVNDTTNTGNDVLLGGAGNDTIYAGGGDDILVGGSGNDTLYGEEGADKLIGGLGADDLYGGAGNDSFIYQSAAEGGDTIKDFNAGTGNGSGKVDEILIDTVGFGLGSLTEANFDALVGIGANLANATSSQKFFIDTSGADAGVYFDADGFGVGNAYVQLAKLESMTGTFDVTDINRLT